MLKQYLLEPEVAGQLGENSVLDYSRQPPIIKTLHYQFDDWLGDDILETFQCFICSESLTQVLKKQGLTGFVIKDCEIGKSQLFFDLNIDDLQLPKFYWFDVIGNKVDDFYLLPNFMLVVSERALNVLKQFNINHCDIKEYYG